MHVAEATFGAGLDVSEYVECSFDGSRLAGSHWAGPEDVQALADAVADLLGPAERAALQARIDRSEPRTVNEFRGNDFSGMELVDVAFRRGIDLRAQILPAGEDTC